MQESVYQPRATPRRVPEDAPNILIVMIDDGGPGQPSTFGGEINTPTMDRIVGEGIAFNRFHTTALCSPTRASLLTGRNHHRVGFGIITEFANDWEGYYGRIPKSSALVAEVLKDYGYATGAWGKWHNTPAEEAGPAGPFENWPTSLGFEYFYGFLGAETSSWEPTLVRNLDYVPPPRTPEEGYHLEEDLADDAVAWIRRQKTYQPDKPLFMYWAAAALHGPHHAPKEWADRYKGKFDDGWDAYRERVFERAKEKGWIPAEAQLTPAHEQMPSWDSIPENEKPFQARLMEVLAGFGEHCDAQIGRIVDELDRLYGENTLIFYIWGDDGPSAQGQNGTISELTAHNGIPTTIEQQLAALEEIGGLDALGGPKTDPIYHSGWAWAGATPYKGTMSIPGYLGATRNPMGVRWPAKIKPDATPRAQFHHVNDIVPTIYEILGITPPREVNGVAQDSIDGVSLAYTFDDPTAEGRLETQYFETLGSRGIYHKGWMASTFGPRVPWVTGVPPGIFEWTPDKDTWELYNLEEDWSQANDLAAELPEKLAQMKDLWLIEATKNNALPIGGGFWILLLSPGVRPGAALHGVDLLRRYRPRAGVHRPETGYPTQRRHDRRRDPRRRQRRAVQAGRVRGRSHLLRGERHPLLRVQPVRDPADEAPRPGSAPDRRGDDPNRHQPRRSQAAAPRPAERGDEGKRRDRRPRNRSHQRAARVYRHRVPRHRRRARLAGLTRLLRQEAVQVQRHDRGRPCQVHGHEITSRSGAGWRRCPVGRT